MAFFSNPLQLFTDPIRLPTGRPLRALFHLDTAVLSLDNAFHLVQVRSSSHFQLVLLCFAGHLSVDYYPDIFHV
jgi:hypothetical protein